MSKLKNLSPNIITCIDPLGFPFKTLDPFLFCVYHKDDYPAGDSSMQAPRPGNGADFNPKAPYRMYHGDRIPGFPQHPHRGFETVTATITGLIDHTDSCGNAGRYGHGDLQWMTAGKGVVHGEMFPLVNQAAPNPLRFFQIWLNLDAKSKMVEPAFVMQWAEDIPRYVSPERDVEITIWAGSLFGIKALPPTPKSWASTASNEVGIWHITLHPNARLSLPAASGGSGINRMVYFIEGESLSIGDTSLAGHSAITLNSSLPADLRNSHSTTVTELLVLQGKPIGEPVAQSGPFVMNTEKEIQTAYADYRRTQFGGWPWPEDAMVFPRDKGRFALSDGTETNPAIRDQSIE